MVGNGYGVRVNLQVHLVHMIAVNMHIAKRMNKLTRLQITHWAIMSVSKA